MNAILLIPVFDEEKYIGRLLQSLMLQLRKISVIKQLVFIDDGSTDKTSQILLSWVASHGSKSLKVKIIRHKKNMGKGAAMRSGMEYAKKGRADAVIFMDGDLQHDPEELTKFVRVLQQSPAIFGYRHEPTNMPLLRKLGNRAFGVLVKALFGTKRKDLLCGFLAFSNTVFNRLEWTSQRYGVEMEIALRIHRLKIPYAEVPIKTIYFDPHKGMNAMDALRMVISIPYWFFWTKNLK